MYYDDQRLDVLADRLTPLALERGFDSLLDYYYLLKYDAGAEDAWCKAIDALSSEEATIVRLQHLEGMTQTEIADKLGIPLGTVKSRSHRAHQQLSRLLGDLRKDFA